MKNRNAAQTSAVVLALAALVFMGCDSGNRQPFYLTDVEALRRLPEEDLLRMRDDILRASARQPDVRVMQGAQSGVIEISQGRLTGASGRWASGSVKILRLADGSHVLRLEDFQVTRAPDLRVRVSESAPSETSASKRDAFVDLGSLEGNAGSQNFPLGEMHVRGVVIESGLFSTRMATATLPPSSAKKRPE